MENKKKNLEYAHRIGFTTYDSTSIRYAIVRSNHVRLDTRVSTRMSDSTLRGKLLDAMRVFRLSMESDQGRKSICVDSMRDAHAHLVEIVSADVVLINPFYLYPCKVKKTHEKMGVFSHYLPTKELPVMTQEDVYDPIAEIRLSQEGGAA